MISASAYRVAVLHAARHPARPVCGLLVGAASEGAENAAGKGGAWAAEAAVPLFHSYALAPPMETALEQAEAHFEARGMAVVGCYVANELLGDVSVAGFVKRLGAAMLARFRGAAIVMLDNRRMGHAGAESAVHAVYRSADGGRTWTPSHPAKSGEGVVAGAPETLEAVRDELAQARLPRVADFEAHMENPSLDWLGQV